MIAFRDFVPRILSHGGLLKGARYASVDDAVDAANRWIAERRVQVINVETLLLPRPHASQETAQETGTTVFSAYQVVRVWYRR